MLLPLEGVIDSFVCDKDLTDYQMFQFDAFAFFSSERPILY